MRTRPMVVSMAFLAVACGCAATPVENAGMEVRLQVGQTEPVNGAGFQVTFDAVGGDSRCAKGETCIWEGSATVRLTLTGTDGSQSFTLHTSPRAGPDAAAYGDWAIRPRRARACAHCGPRVCVVEPMSRLCASGAALRARPRISSTRRRKKGRPRGRPLFRRSGTCRGQAVSGTAGPSGRRHTSRRRRRSRRCRSRSEA